jgi:hypothetical protein
MKNYFWHAKAMLIYGGENRKHLANWYLTGDGIVRDHCRNLLADMFEKYNDQAEELRKAEFDQKELELKGGEL